jgi:hypothetical protein
VSKDERIELRCAGGPLLGVLVGGTAIEVKRGARLFEIDILSTLALGAPVILERMLQVEGTGNGEQGAMSGREDVNAHPSE